MCDSHKKGPSVSVLRVQALAIREILTQPMRDSSPCSSLGGLPPSSKPESPTRVAVGKGGIVNAKIGQRRLASANGRRGVKVRVQCSKVEVATIHVSMRTPHACPYDAASTEYSGI